MESHVHVPPRETASSWTDEKHVDFLNAMEASFVTAMFENNGGLLRLDRYLPDTADSTLDLNPHRTTKKHASSGKRDKMEGRRIRKRSSQPFINSSEDQVVPQVQLENAREGGAADTGDDEERQRN